MFGSRQDQDRGRKGEEITDADAEKKYQQILELLLTGGYFRARINGISPFDKILGGLAWAISASNVDVDIDVFQETAALGQKLKIGESVVRSLVKMQCPYPLQTYQIKGLDYINIFPVVQWLVKKVIETRMETGDTARRFSEYEYSRVMPMEKDKDVVRPQQVEFVHELREKYMPQRHFKRHRKVQPTSTRTLLEYGNLKKRGGDTEQAQDDGEYDADEYMDDIGDSTKVAGSVVGSYMQTDEIKQASAAYGGAGKKKKEDEEDESGKGGAMLEEKLLHQKIARANKAVERIQAELEAARAAFAAREEEIGAMEAALAKKQRLTKRVQDAIAKLMALETPENQHLLKRLRELVALKEQLNAQEEKFKANCKRHMAELQEEIERRRKSMYGVSDLERIDLINETFEVDTQKLEKVRALWAKKGRDLALVERKLDDVPSRAELAQYQRMFVELYEQVATKLVETRRYYTTYNRLDDTRLCLDQEVKYLESIVEGYERCVKAKTSREKLLESLHTIVEQIQVNIDKKEAELAKEKESYTELNDKLRSALEKERAFFTATRDFQEECKKNEQLEQKLALVEGM